MIQDYSGKEVGGAECGGLLGQIKDCNEEAAVQVIGNTKEDNR